MNTLKTTVTAAVGLALAAVAVRTMRKRGTGTPTETVDADERSTGDPSAVAERATVAAEHARQELGTTDSAGRDDDEDPPVPQPIRRLRRVGKGWIRR